MNGQPCGWEASRRAWLATLAGLAGLTGPLGSAAAGTTPADAAADTVRRGRALRFPRDHGAHPGAGIEWWYLTGWLAAGAAADATAPSHGFQITFFRRRTGLAGHSTSRFAAKQLLFAHAAVTDLARRQHHHDQRLTRWDGASTTPVARCATNDTALAVQRWTFDRQGSTLRAQIAGPAPLEMTLALEPTQPLLLQGDAGFSRKGPDERHASHYYSLPQLAVRATLGGARQGLSGRAWLDHEWSDELMAPDAVGWDWIGINLADGSALTAFRLRRADAAPLWAGGSWRSAAGELRVFAPAEVRFEPLRHWVSPATATRWPVRWRVHSPAGVHEVNALLDAQELDHRQGTGVLYWEGLSELLDSSGRRVGLGYLELTGYGQRLRLG